MCVCPPQVPDLSLPATYSAIGLHCTIAFVMLCPVFVEFVVFSSLFCLCVLVCFISIYLSSCSLFFFFFLFFYWSIVELQCCIHQCYMAKWLSSILFFICFSIIIYHRISSIFPCAVQWDPVVYPFCIYQFASANPRLTIQTRPSLLPLGNPQFILCFCFIVRFLCLIF